MSSISSNYFDFTVPGLPEPFPLAKKIGRLVVANDSASNFPLGSAAIFTSSILAILPTGNKKQIQPNIHPKIFPIHFISILPPNKNLKAQGRRPGLKHALQSASTEPRKFFALSYQFIRLVVRLLPLPQPEFLFYEVGYTSFRDFSLEF